MPAFAYVSRDAERPFAFNSQPPTANSQPGLGVGNWELGVFVMIQFMKRAGFFAVVATLLACSSAPAQQAGADVAARVGDRAITVKDLDDRWRAADPAGHAEATQKLYE